MRELENRPSSSFVALAFKWFSIISGEIGAIVPAVHHSASFRQILHVSKEIFYPIQRHRRDDRWFSRFVIARTIYLLLLFLFLLIKILFHVGLFSFYLSPWSPSSPFTSRFLSTRPFFAHAFSNADSTHIHPFVSHFHAHIELSLSSSPAGVPRRLVHVSCRPTC